METLLIVSGMIVLAALASIYARMVAYNEYRRLSKQNRSVGTPFVIKERDDTDSSMRIVAAANSEKVESRK